MAKLTAAAAEATLRAAVAGYVQGLTTTLRALPDGVDAALVVDAVRTLLGNTWGFARSCQRLPPPVIRGLLASARPSAGGDDWRGHPDANLVFLKQAVDAALDDDALAAAWAQALRALLDTNTTYAWGSRQRRAKIRALADGPFLPAFHAAAAGCAKVPLDFLAVLAADGSSESADALLPHFHRAAVAKDSGLDLLESLRKHAAPTPAVSALLAEVERLLGARQAASPALELARAAGFGALETFWFWVFVGSREHTPSRVPLYQCNLLIDSSSATWFHASVSRVDGSLESRATSFSERELHRDALGLGRCEADELPAWLARAAATLGCEWHWRAEGLRTPLRGKARQQLLDWLAGAPRSGH